MINPTVSPTTLIKVLTGSLLAVLLAFLPTLLAGLLPGLLPAIASTQIHAAESDEFDAAAKYQSTCYACHGTGQAHAPLMGDEIEWEIRLDKGMETLVRNTINGLNGMMPPRGLCADCSDEQLRAIVEYMLEQSR